jgi:hypothetical protein
VWINDPTFHELGNERDPIIGNQDGTFEFKVPKRPIRKVLKGLPAFTTVKAGPTSFCPVSTVCDTSRHFKPNDRRRRGTS